jgi:EAL domain-containing protein (putative c-di-GMP-specific phosphodiesterase class I)
MQAAASAKAALTAALREGLRERQFVLHYQPQVQASGCITGAEALLRWAHPEGLRGPDGFIAQAEESGLILPLGQWVLEQACEQLARWSTQPGRRDLRLSVNVSARQFLQPQFVQQVLQCVAHHQIDPRRLELEITESLLATDLSGTIARMQALRQAGLGLAIDDFGMGYSALSCLKHMPLQRLKIDRSFVKDMIEDPRDAAIARTIIELATDLGLQVLAEGVETLAQRDLLSRLGCQAYQGFLFSPALPIGPFESLLSHWRPAEHRVAQGQPKNL